MNKIKAVLFDLDGTLLDTSPGVLSSVKYTIEKMGFQSLSEDALEEFIGPPIRKKWQRSMESRMNLQERQWSVSGKIMAGKICIRQRRIRD